MRSFVLAILLLALLLTTPSRAWNDTGHMVVAQLAWQRLTPEQRQAVTAILREHPHWREFLVTQRPDNVPEDQWAFWRAATWPDWVKHEHQQFNHPKWHYINIPFVPAGSSLRVADHEPGNENILTALAQSIDKLRTSTGQERAINLCWVLHLIGDLHQPLHCATLFCEQFPRGDKGGNDSLYRLGSRRIIKLHTYWDDLLGKSETPSAIMHGADEAQRALAANRAEVTREEQANSGIESWAKEGFELAVVPLMPTAGSSRRWLTGAESPMKCQKRRGTTPLKLTWSPTSLWPRLASGWQGCWGQW